MACSCSLNSRRRLALSVYRRIDAIAIWQVGKPRRRWRLEPSPRQLRDRLAQLMDFIGLAEDREVAADVGRGVAVAGGQQHRQVGTNFPDATGEGEPIHLPGHNDIGKNEIDAVAGDFPQRRFGIRDRTNGIAELLEQADADRGNVRIVFDEQDGAAAVALDAIDAVKLQAGIGARQQDRYLRSLAEFARHLDLSAGLMGETVHLRKAKPGALADRLGREKRIEYLVKQVGRDADAPIPDRDGDIVAFISGSAGILIMRGDHDRAARGHGVTGVDDEIDQRRLQFGDVDHDGPDVAIDVELKPDGAADAGVEHFANRVDPFGEINDLRIDALAPGKGQQLAGQRGAALCGRLDRRYRALKLCVAADAFLQRVDAAADDHQEIVEVVRDAAGQLAERIELLRFGELLLHLLEFELRLAPLGNVAGDFCKADEPAVLPDGIDDDAGPEEGAVLTDAPAFLFIAALFPGDPQRPFRLAAGSIGLGVEARKMPTDDLPG